MVLPQPPKADVSHVRGAAWTVHGVAQHLRRTGSSPAAGISPDCVSRIEGHHLSELASGSEEASTASSGFLLQDPRGWNVRSAWLSRNITALVRCAHSSDAYSS